MFHPFEMAVCGASGSGKTTLLERLTAYLAPEHRVGYAKHSSHDFTMDRAGKDTDRARTAGAVRVFITNDRATGMATGETVDLVQRRTAFDDCDFVLAEGWKQSPLPRLMMMGTDAHSGAGSPGDKAGPVLAWVGVQRPADLPAGMPWFDRDDIAAIAGFLLAHWRTHAAVPLHGLVLAGGHSTRMQRDKATLEYHGRTQLEQAFDLLSGLCAQTFVSARREQLDDPAFRRFPLIQDSVLDCGPTGGMLSAMRAHPTAAWLVLACDLPHLDVGTLQELIRQRNPLKVATAYVSANDGLPEPLCAIYEPRALSRLYQFLAIGTNCPRKMLINSNVRLLELGNRAALENINRPEEYEAARRALGAR